MPTSILGWQRAVDSAWQALVQPTGAAATVVKALRPVRQGPGAGDARFTEGDDPRGSYAQTDGHGHGTIFIDRTQAAQYDQVRIAAHETGHALGLPDDYTGPCEELMSGGGPGPTCTASYPDQEEIDKVNALWANGFRPQTREPQRVYEPVS